MEKALTKMLTPTSSLDLLREIQHTNATTSRPYVLSIVGVNGVGKSTNLSKIAFFLLQNHHRVLIAAADTFRSGAVEQLRVHVDRLKELSQRRSGRFIRKGIWQGRRKHCSRRRYLCLEEQLQRCAHRYRWSPSQRSTSYVFA
jgi:signal recognition particle GTPase